MKRNSAISKEIHNLLQKTVIPPGFFELWLNNHPGLMAAQLKPLNTYLEDKAPKKLYRLRSFSKNSVKALEEGKLFFSRADKFNDPYDCLLRVDSNKLREKVFKQISDSQFKGYLQSIGLKFPVNDSIKSLDDIVALSGMYRDKFLDDVTATFPNIIDLLQKGTYITCLSETVTSPIMWSHYSDNHKGFAIEYNFEPSFFCPAPHLPGDNKFNGYGWRSLLPVHYSKLRADAIDLVDWYALCEMQEKCGCNLDATYYIPDMLLKTKLCLEKHEAWAYEKEWRIILTFEWPNKFCDYNIHLKYDATAIYLGTRMAKNERQKLITIAKKINIPVYEMYIDHSSGEYEMQYRPL